MVIWKKPGLTIGLSGWVPSSLVVRVIEATEDDDVVAQDEAQDDEQDREEADEEEPEDLSDRIEVFAQKDFFVKVFDLHVWVDRISAAVAVSRNENDSKYFWVSTYKIKMINNESWLMWKK